MIIHFCPENSITQQQSRVNFCKMGTVQSSTYVEENNFLPKSATGLLIFQLKPLLHKNVLGCFHLPFLSQFLLIQVY